MNQNGLFGILSNDQERAEYEDVKRERWATVFDRADIGERENNISYNESNI